MHKILGCLVVLLALAFADEVLDFEDNWAPNPLFNLVSQSASGVEVIFSTHRVVIEEMEIGNMATFISIAENNNMDISTPVLRVFPSVSSSHLNILCAFGVVLKNGRLKIYDVTGRNVKEFDLSGFEMNQPTSLVWDRCDDMGRRVAAGVYFVRLEADDYTKTEKAILLR